MHDGDPQIAALEVRQGQEARAIALVGCPRLPGIAATCLRAEASQPLLPSRNQATQQALDQLGCSLSRDGRLLPGVIDLRVQINAPAQTRLGEPPAMPQVVALALTTGAFREEALRQLLLGAVPNLSNQRLTILSSPSSAPAIPATVTHATPAALIPQGIVPWGLATLFGLNLLLTGLLFVRLSGRRPGAAPTSDHSPSVVRPPPKSHSERLDVPDTTP